MNPIIEYSKKITSSRFFNTFIFLLILGSVILIGLETYPNIASVHKDLFHLLDRLIIWAFTVEITLKIIAKGRKPWEFFFDPWNVLDFIIVAVCLFPSSDTHFFAIFRILRVLRILRMITFLPKLRLLIGALIKSIPSMGYVILLIAILFFVYAVVGVFLFGPSDPVNFGDLHHAFVTLFKILTLEGWTDIMDRHVYGTVSENSVRIISVWPFLYFASFILIGAMIIMNLFIGVIMNSMEESQKELAREITEIHLKDKDPEELYMHIISKLDELRNDIQNLKK